MRIKTVSLLVLTAALSACGGAPSRPSPHANAEPASAEVPVALPADAPTRICLRMIEVKWTGTAGAPETLHRTEEQARIRAEMIAGEAATPEANFTEIAHMYADASIVGDTCDQGRIVVRGAGTLDPALEALAFALDINEVSNPLRTDHGFVIAMRGPDAAAVPEEIAARHILIRYASDSSTGVTRTREEARALAEQVLAEVRAPNADWNALVARYSEEPGAAERHGDLGRFGHGRMVRSFERAAFELDVGEVSDVVETTFGFHIIHRYE